VDRDPTPLPPPPPVTIIRHRKERRSKCSLTPLEPLPGFAFYTYPQDEPDVGGHLRLSLEGPPLTPSDRERPLLLLDGTWRLVAPIERRYADVEPRSLPRAATAYRRVSKVFPDPDAGLASIEALIVAFQVLGTDPTPLVERYLWGTDFLDRNPELFAP